MCAAVPNDRDAERVKAVLCSSEQTAGDARRNIVALTCNCILDEMAIELLEVAPPTTSIRESMSFALECEPPDPHDRSAVFGTAHASVTESGFLRLIEPLKEAALLLDRGGQVLSCNALFADLVGSPRSIVLGQIFASYLANDEEAAFRGLLARTRSGTGCATFRLLHMDNSAIAVRITLCALRIATRNSPMIRATVVALDSGKCESHATGMLRPMDACFDSKTMRRS